MSKQMNELKLSSRAALSVLALLLMSACASPPEARTTEAACGVLKPIAYHQCKPEDGPENEANECDTPETAIEIDAYNRDLQKLCPHIDYGLEGP